MRNLDQNQIPDAVGMSPDTSHNVYKNVYLCNISQI